MANTSVGLLGKDKGVCSWMRRPPFTEYVKRLTFLVKGSYHTDFEMSSV